MRRSNFLSPQQKGTPKMSTTPNQEARLSSAMKNLSLTMRNESEMAFTELHHRIEYEKQEELMTTKNQYETLLSFMLSKMEQSSAEMIAELIQQQHVVQEEWIQEHQEAQQLMIERIHAEHEAAMDKIRADLVAYDGHMMIREQQAKRSAAALLDQKQVELDELRREKDCEIASINLQNSKLLLTQQEGFAVELARQRDSFLIQLADAAADLEALHKEFQHQLIVERQEVANEVETASAEMLASMVEEHTKYNESMQQECDEKVRQAQAKLSMKVGAFITGGSEYEELLAENNRLKDQEVHRSLQSENETLQVENETLQLRITELTDALNNALSSVESEQSQRTRLIEEHNLKVTEYQTEVERLIHVREEKEEEVEMFRSETQRLNQALTELTEQLDALRREGVKSGMGGDNTLENNSGGVQSSSSGGGSRRGVKSSIITGGSQRKHAEIPIANPNPINDTITPVTPTTTITNDAIEHSSPVPSFLDAAAFFPSESSRRRVSDRSPNAIAPSSSHNTTPSAMPFTPSIALLNTTPSTPAPPTPITPQDNNNATDTPSIEHVMTTTPTNHDSASSDSTPVGNDSNGNDGSSAVSGSGGGGSAGKGGSTSKSRVQELIAKMNRGKLTNNNNNSNSNRDLSQDQGP